jgi:hypothetical protein
MKWPLPSSIIAPGRDLARRPLSAVWSALARVAFAVGLMIAAAFPSQSQQWRWSYDSSGNLLIQALETSLPPEILGQPVAQVAELGDVVTFSVVLAATAGVSYQWYFRGATVPGANADTLFLSNVGTTNEGQYSVVVANSFGSVTSAPVPLMIDSLGGGMPDSWQSLHFGTIGVNPLGDADGDGVSNLDEFFEGTDPSDPRSFKPRLQVQSTAHGHVNASPGLPYYSLGQYVTLTAVADPFSTFQGWGGAVHGLKTQISVLMDGHKSVTASFSVAVAPPVFESINVINGNLGLTWSAVPGRAYQLQYRTDLQQGAWVNLGGINIASGPTLTIYDPLGLDPQRFYRVGLLP